MKAKVCMVVLFGLVVLCLAACACGTSKPATAEVPPPPVARAEPAPQPPPPEAKAPESVVPEPVAQKPAPASVFFATDKSEITPEAAVVLKNQAEWLKENPEAKVEISGNTDQRASEEYNQALGQKRADAVKEYLVGLGVSGDRLETASYGKEKPLCSDLTKDCHATNRRADLNVG
jgi:peptidoglycan-associated lipoprotein